MKDDIITTATTVKRLPHTDGLDCRACRSRDRSAASAARTRRLIQDIKVRHSFCPHKHTAIFIELDSEGRGGQVLEGTTYERCLAPWCGKILRYGV